MYRTPPSRAKLQSLLRFLSLERPGLVLAAGRSVDAGGCVVPKGGEIMEPCKEQIGEEVDQTPGMLCAGRVFKGI
jgi:hypothetical protein